MTDRKMKSGTRIVKATAVFLLACSTAPPSAPAPALLPAAAPASAPAPAPAPPEAKAAPKMIAPARPTKRPGSYANIDPDDDSVVGPPDVIADCDAELKKAGVTFRAATLAVHPEGKSKMLCGAPQVVTYVKGPGNIAYSSSPLLTCGMALALASFEKVLQEEANQVLHSPIVRIEHLGTYNCREMVAYPGWVSEHSYANAIDLASFTLKDGRTIDVLHDFDASPVDDPPPKKAAARFLRNVSRRANDEDVFSHVLTPFFDALHKNHFHLDLARYRADGTRPQG